MKSITTITTITSILKGSVLDLGGLLIDHSLFGYLAIWLFGCLAIGCGGWTISGTVWDSESLETLPNVKVKVSSSTGELRSTTVTDAKGYFQVKSLKSKQKYKLQFSGDIMEAKEEEYDLRKLSKDKVKNCVINMELLCAIEGDVLDENGFPIYDAPVQLIIESKSQEEAFVFQSIEYTNTTGSFRFFGLRPERYRLRVDKPGYKIFDCPPDNMPPFELKKGQIWSAHLKLEPIPEMPIPELKPPKGKENILSPGGEVISGE
jgi:protocatechuate 3,4-dioxygenase beta subunit